MPRRKAEPETSPARQGALRDAGVIVVASRRAQRDALGARLSGRCRKVSLVADAAHALAIVRDADLVIVESAHAIEICATLIAANPALGCVVLHDDAGHDYLLSAMRTGVADVLPEKVGESALATALERTLARARTARRALLREKRRTRRLRDLCRHLFRSRHELMKQMGSMCEGLSGSYRELSAQLRNVSMASELNAILRQELDIESLLRTVLEYALKKSGPTNAAIFLSNSHGDYSLGAYVNYDCAKDSCESMLDHLADVAAPAFEEREGAVVMRDFGEVCTALGREADWLQDSTMVALACRHDGECLGVMTFFRDRRNPFEDEAVQSLRIIGELFAQQLSRVIRTHHRHLPKDQWGNPGDGGLGPDDIDLAA